MKDFISMTRIIWKRKSIDEGGIGMDWKRKIKIQAKMGKMVFRQSIISCSLLAGRLGHWHLKFLRKAVEGRGMYRRLTWRAGNRKRTVWADCSCSAMTVAAAGSQHLHCPVTFCGIWTRRRELSLCCRHYPTVLGSDQWSAFFRLLLSQHPKPEKYIKKEIGIDNLQLYKCWSAETWSAIICWVNK